jgi:outer membrane protein OmpA-like peptidoglycan-associated protein
MKYLLQCLFIFLFVAFTSNWALAQGQKDLTSNNRKAIKAYNEGLDALQYRKMELAELSFLEALEADPNFIEARLVISELYTQIREYEKAIAQLTAAIAINPEFHINAFYSLATLELGEGQYENAKKHYLQFLSFPRLNSELAENAQLMLKNCDFALNAIKNPVAFKPINMGEEVNSEYDEYFPCITADNLYFLYTRNIPSGMDGGGFSSTQEDFYLAMNSAQGWNKSRNIGPPINTALNEGAPTLSVDGQILIFTACEIFDSYGPGRKGFGSCDLFVCQRIGDRWSKPMNLGPPINTPHWETQPSLGADGKTLYFIRGFSSRNGVRDQDIYVTQIDDEGRWSTPERLNANINSPLREESVFIHPDGKTLYFSSEGHTGMGGLDIYVSKKDENDDWGPAQNLGYPINTSKHENSLLVNASGELGYFASSRSGGFGGLDLYQFELPEHLRPELVTYFKGKVYDAKTKAPLESKFELIDLETGKLAMESWSNRGNGEFLVALPTNRNYALNVSKDGYLFYSENFELKGEAKASKPVVKDVPLQPIAVGESVVLRNIFFETAKYNLKPASEIELKKLITFLNNNPKITIELGGHTDNVGSDADNQLLSENRAKSVYNYLVNNGVESTRLQYKGYGESKPVATNDTEAGRAQNRRTEFKILSKD